MAKETALLDIEPLLPIGGDWVYVLQWVMGILLAGIVLWVGFLFLRRHLPSLQQRWLKKKWLRQLESFTDAQCASKRLKKWLLRRYVHLKKWPLNAEQQQQLNLWLFSSAPVDCHALKVWIETLPVADWRSSVRRLADV
ncbi:hypothetical protein [Galenea microaerophila]